MQRNLSLLLQQAQLLDLNRKFKNHLHKVFLVDLNQHLAEVLLVQNQLLVKPFQEECLEENLKGLLQF